MTRQRKRAEALIAYGAVFGMDTMAASGEFRRALTCPHCGCFPCGRVSPGGDDAKCKCRRSCYPLTRRDGAGSLRPAARAGASVSAGKTMSANEQRIHAFDAYPCPVCKTTGWLPCPEEHPAGEEHPGEEMCPRCDGWGYLTIGCCEHDDCG